GCGRQEADHRDDREDAPRDRTEREGSGDDAHGKPPFKPAPGRPLASLRRGPEHVVEVVGDAGRGELVEELGEVAFDSVECRHAYCPPATGDRAVSVSLSIAARISASDRW